MEYTPKRFHCPAAMALSLWKTCPKRICPLPRCLTAIHEADGEGTTNARRQATAHFHLGEA